MKPARVWARNYLISVTRNFAGEPKNTINVNNQEYPLYTVYHTDSNWLGWSFPGKFNRKEVDLTGGYS